jgi:serine/threonine-protein kinase HipA
MPKIAAVLGVHRLGPDSSATRVGTLTRDIDGSTAFVVDEAYLRNPARPAVSLSWTVPGDEAKTRARLTDRGDKIGLHGGLPPWFSGLLPEGALRDLVLAEMGPGDHDQFDLLTRLGGDLPGAVMVVPETPAPTSAGPLRLEQIHGFEAPRPEGLVKFSLAGVQLKFAAETTGGRLTVTGRIGATRSIIKVPSDRFPLLPEAEFAAMQLAAMIGVTTPACRLVDTANVDGIPAELLRHGPNVLVVERFDRLVDGTRIHIEDAGQVVGALGERKYTMATTETVLNMIRRFSTDRRADLLEGFRRVVADVLLGNGDNHLKNWSFIFPAPGEVRLSPAYDIVPTVLYAPADTLALRFVGTHSFTNVNLRRFRRVAEYLGLDPEWIAAETVQTVRRALKLWPAALPELLDEQRASRLLDRLETLSLVAEARV